MNGLAECRAHSRHDWGRGARNARPAKQVWSDGQASHSCLCFLLFSFIMPSTASCLPGMDPSTSGSTHRVHSLAPRDGPTFLRAHSPSLEPFCSDVYLCPSHVSLRNRSQLSLQKTTVFCSPYTNTYRAHLTYELRSQQCSHSLPWSFWEAQKAGGSPFSEQSQMSVLDLCPGLGYKSQKLEA